MRFKMKRLIEQLKIHEGFKSNYYLCTASKKTIGYGRNVENNPFTDEERAYLGRINFDDKPMTKVEAEYLLVNDVAVVTSQVEQLLPCNDLNQPRHAVCVNMAFNLGVSGFSKFKNMIKAIENASYEKASNEMMDSKWARQVSNRANQLSIQMHSGTWQ